MTDYFVGTGGNDGSDGLSWANRKLTLNGAEDVPVAAADTVYVGPGVYREQLTVDVSGTAGNIITYIADKTGENTDGVGGIVRVTGSDNDTTMTRGRCIHTGTRRNYRTFRGFAFDMASNDGVNWTDGNDIVIEDCVFQGPMGNPCINFSGANQASHIIRRCVFFPTGTAIRAIIFSHSVTVDNTSHLVENCIFIGMTAGSNVVEVSRTGGIDFRNCLWLGGGTGIRIQVALSGGQTVDVNNCIFNGLQLGLRATTTAELIEDYNAFSVNGTDRTTVNTGANSNTYPSLFLVPSLLDGFKFPWQFSELSEWSQVAAIAGTGEATDDLFGLTRPVTSAKKSWGPVQFVDAERETGTVQAGSVGRVLNDAGLKFVRRVPVDNTSTTITLYVRKQTNYAGSEPRMIIRQPGQSDSTDTLTVAVDTWEQLSVTLTPAALPPYVDVYVESRNTATSGSYKVFYDTMAVS